MQVLTPACLSRRTPYIVQRALLHQVDQCFALKLELKKFNLASTGYLTSYQAAVYCVREVCSRVQERERGGGGEIGSEEG